MKLVFLSEEEIFVKKAPRRRTRPVREGYFLKSFGDLKEDDFVVHTDFGIGVYRGLKKITVGKIENDFLVIEYLDGDKLYIPVNSLEKIQRYLGPDGYVPKIDKMGGTSWEAVKEKVKKSVREVAEELVAIYAAREALERKSFAPPDRIYEEFCSTFEFEETPDQAKAIEDIHLDMDESKADGSFNLRRCRFWQNGSCDSISFSRCNGRQTGCCSGADNYSGGTALSDFLPQV